MIYGSLLYRDYDKNALFTPGAGENNGEFYLPYRLLKERMAQEGIELNTPDVNQGRSVAFELHINARRQAPQSRAYTYLFENPLIRPLNRDLEALGRYAKWFTWDAELLGQPKAIELPYPNDLRPRPAVGFNQRPYFCSLVASNKALAINDPRDQYQERVKIINWFERHAPDDFHLFGRGWERPAARAGRWGRVYNQVQKLWGRVRPLKSPYATWHGPVDDKLQVMQQSRFCLAHENCRDLEGYITEKIFDSFRAGCVPVYVGPADIARWIPSNCFIDGRQFPKPESLYAALKQVDEAAFATYQTHIQNFLASPAAACFSQENFVEVLTTKIRDDLKAAGV
jgi:hypothetical protein